MSDTAVKQLRVVLVTEDFDAAVRYYRDTLGLSESAAIAGPDGARVVILEAGRATLELANAAQARFIAEVEIGVPDRARRGRRDPRRHPAYRLPRPRRGGGLLQL